MEVFVGKSIYYCEHRTNKNEIPNIAISCEDIIYHKKIDKNRNEPYYSRFHIF